MALFKKKSPSDNGGPESGGDEGFQPQPEKARKWFAHAKTSADSFNYAYALQCYANGIRFDPGDMQAHQAMLDAAVAYFNNGGKSASGKEIKSLDDGTPVGKFAAAEFEWMKEITNHKAALKAVAAAGKADQLEFGRWISPRVLTLLRNQHQKKRLSKGALVQAMETFREVGAWEESMICGELAREVDPSDNELAAELKNLAAQRAMDQGGYTEAVGEEGGFRRSIRDIDKQRELEEEESISGGSAEERNIERARINYEENPTFPDAINRYAQLLKRLGTPEAEQQARDVYQKGFEDTGEYRFRMQAGDIEIQQLERRLDRLNEALENNPDNESSKAERDEVRGKLLEIKSREYTERVKRYPTDRFRKFDLGMVLFERGEAGEAMAHFQKAKDEPKLRVRAGHMLGRCFLNDDWYTEAISEFEEALAVIEATDREYELVIRYDLMCALLEAAREEQDIDFARQAKNICSDIARKDITYRDIRAKRKEVDQLIKELTGE